jgi:uncharacterized repeat protein (TIGR03806 family)
MNRLIFQGFAAAMLFPAFLCLGCSPKKEAAPTPPPAAAPAENAPSAAVAEEDDFEFYTPKALPPAMLSEYGLFADLAAQTPAEGVFPYVLNTECFADDARVRRFFRLPGGASIEYREEGALDFPVDTVFVQTFSYPKDARDPGAGERLVETRLLRRDAEGWEGLAYIWNEEGTDARRAIAGGVVNVTLRGADGNPTEFKHVVLNQNDCKRCHEFDRAVHVIGPTAANLNTEIVQDAASTHQLADWIARGLLRGAPAEAAVLPRLARWNDPASGSVEQRARAWLAVNCAHCHNPGGAGGVSGLDLRLSQSDPVRIGIFKPPVAAGRGSEGLRYSIEPGRPEASFLINRLRSVDPSVMMPPIGRRTSSAEAAALISEWIASMHYDEAEAQRLIAIQQELLEEMKRSGTFVETATQ